MVGNDIADYFDTLYRKAILLESLETEFRGLAPGAERSDVIRKQSEIKDWLQEQYKVLDEKFSGMLELSH